MGAITPTAVTSSGISSVNSIFVSIESNGTGGTVVTVRDANNGLARTSNPSTVIPSSTATLVAGTQGFGACVFSATRHSDSPTALAKASPYDSTCNKTTGHSVGILDTTNRTILSSTGALKGGEAEILLKAAVSSSTSNADDYGDTLTFVASPTY